MLLVVCDKLLDVAHALDALGYEHALPVPVTLAVGKIDDIHGRDARRPESFEVPPLDPEGQDTSELKQEVVREVVLLPF